MADFASALVARVIASGATGSKAYWVKIPQNTPLPYIRLQTISDPRPEHLQGYNGARVTRVQADCFAETYKAARAAAETLISTLTAPATVGGIVFGHTKAEGPRDLGEDTASGFVHRASLDLLVEHRLA